MAGELGFRRLVEVKQKRIDNLQKQKSGVVRNALAVEASRENHPSAWEKFRTALRNTNQTLQKTVKLNHWVVRDYDKLVNAVNSLENHVRDLPDIQLRERTTEFQERFKKGLGTDIILGGNPEMLAAVGLPGSILSPRSSPCLSHSISHLRLGNRRWKVVAPTVADDKQWQCRCFVEEVSHAWRDWRGRKNPSRLEKDRKKLPVVIFEGGRRWQYVFDGEQIHTVEVDEELQNGEGRDDGVSGRITENVVKLKHTLQRIFVPDQVRPHYVVYLKWKLFHRFLSSILHFQCTQAMLWAIGVGAQRRLPAAAALNWVMKDGLGRLGKLLFAASLGRTFDSNLKRVRFSTSAFWSLSVGLEMITPLFPQHFLLLATLANVLKSISSLVYNATSSAIHRSFALGDNYADISAKGQAQTVVADNLGLAVAICLSQFIHRYPTIEKILPFAMYPCMASVELYAIYQQLKAVHLQTLNKERLEIVIYSWIKERRIPSFEEVSKVESASVFNFFNGCERRLPLRIGAASMRSLTPSGLMNVLDLHESQRYALCLEPLAPSPFRGHITFSQPGLLLWLHEKADTEDTIMGVLQACLIGAQITSEAGLQQLGNQYENRGFDGTWQDLLLESRQNAETDFQTLLLAIKDGGWVTKHILLNPKEKCSFSILKH